MNNANFTQKIGSYIGWLLLFCALGFYGYGIVTAIQQTLIGQINFPGFLQNAVSAIQALLLTNLGAVLGIAVTKPDSTIARAIRLGSDNASAATLAPTSPSETKQNIQLYAMILYVMSLIACTICWIVSGYQTDTTRIVPVIAESGNMFLAVVLAYVAAILAR